MKIIITDIESHLPILRQWFFNGEEKVGRFLTSLECVVKIANERAGFKDNLLWHGYRYFYNEDSKEHIFLK